MPNKVRDEDEKRVALAYQFTGRSLVHRHTDRRKVIFLLAAAPLVIFLGGCVTVGFDVSIPQEIPIGAVNKVSAEVITLELPALNLSAQLQNYRPDGGASPRPLTLWLGLEAKNEGLAIDPSGIALRTDNGTNLRPLTFMGPAAPWVSVRAAGMGCGPRRYTWGWSISRVDLSLDDAKTGNPAKGVSKPPVGSISFRGRACFMVWFDTDPSPERIFVLSVNGITKAGQSIKIPEITFKKGFVTKYFPLL